MMKTKEGNIATFIGEGTIITGNIEIKNNVHIDGLVKGNIKCGESVFLGKKGIIYGDVESKMAIIAGKIVGNVKVTGLQIKKDGFIKGEIRTKSLNIEDGASFSGNCFMDIGQLEKELIDKFSKDKKVGDKNKK